MVSHIGKFVSMGVLLVLITSTANALQISSTKDYSNASSREYFISPDENLVTSRNVRSGPEKWLWQHDALDISSLSGDIKTREIKIDAYMNVSGANTDGLNTIYVWSGSSWVLTGDLVGPNNTWSSTTLTLPDIDGIDTQASRGLYFYVDIQNPSEGNNSLTLRSSTVTFSDEIVVSEVSEPGSLFLLGLSLSGLGFFRRKRSH